jgi:predicted aminopeptidase
MDRDPRAEEPPAPPPRRAWSWPRLLLALACGGLAGCGDLSLDLPYYWQSVSGQLALTQQARPIAEVLEGDEVDARVRPKLRRALEIREFASRELALPANGSYRRYADLRRPFVVWNVFATPELSMQLKQWCFPVAGCVTYRGYFDREAAERYAQALRDQGWEAYVSGVPAYSTLGWFDDPVLNTFVHYPDGELARLIFHELAHQVVYVKGDSTFNESFATAVEEAGVERWLKASGDPALEAGYQAFAERRRQFVALLRRHKAALEEVYRRPGSDDEKRAGKAAVFEALQTDYRALKAQWGGYAGYDRWFGQKLTNAHLASVATYNAQVPGFRRLLAQADGDLPAFYDQVRALSKRDKAERDRVLEGGAP